MMKRSFNMSKYRTVAEYKAMLKAMPTQELLGLDKTYSGCQSLGVNDIIIRDLIEAEVEDRIARWEIAEV